MPQAIESSGGKFDEDLKRFWRFAVDFREMRVVRSARKKIATAVLGSTRSSERFCQMTDKMRLAGVDAEIFETPTSKDCFVQERTVMKNEAMSESRT